MIIKTVYSNIRMADPFSLVDILHHTDQLTIPESKEELEKVQALI